MPEAIIRDPKMNPWEKNYGIIYIKDLGGNFIYEKKRSFNRNFVAGSIIKFDNSIDNQITYYPIERIYDGIPVIGEIKSVKFTDKTDSSNAPVIDFLKTNGSGLLDDQKLDELMKDKTDII